MKEQWSETDSSAKCVLIGFRCTN